MIERVRGATVSPEELDAQCIAWRHHERRVSSCPNPRCPSVHPEEWAAFRDLEALREDTGAHERPEDPAADS